MCMWLYNTASLSISYNPSTGFLTKTWLRKGSDYMYLCFFLSLLDDIFHSHWYYSPEEMNISTWCIFFCISYRLWMPGTLLMCLSVSFFNHTQCFHYYWHDGSLKVSHFFDIHFQVFLFTNLITFYDRRHYLLSFVYQLEGMFSFIVLNNYIWLVALYLSIRLDSKIRNNNNKPFCFWFWLVFLAFFIMQYYIIFTYVPMNIVYYFIIPFFILY